MQIARAMKLRPLHISAGLPDPVAAACVRDHFAAAVGVEAAATVGRFVGQGCCPEVAAAPFVADAIACADSDADGADVAVA